MWNEVTLYFTTLLFVTLLLLEGILLSIKYAPLKIKSMFILVFLGMMTRYISAFILLLVPNIRFLYLLKPFVFLNLIFVPIGALTAMFILWRKDGLKFDFIFYIAAALVLVYVIAQSKFSIQVQFFKQFGYRIVFLKNFIIEGAYLVFYFALFIATVELIRRVRLGKIGAMLLCTASLLSMGEVIIVLLGITIFPEKIWGDLVWLCVMNYSITKLKE